MSELFDAYRPRLKWYHYLVVLFLGLPIGPGDTGGPYVVAGTVLGSFAVVWLVVAVLRRVRGVQPDTATATPE